MGGLIWPFPHGVVEKGVDTGKGNSTEVGSPKAGGEMTWSSTQSKKKQSLKSKPGKVHGPGASAVDAGATSKSRKTGRRGNQRSWVAKGGQPLFQVEGPLKKKKRDWET